LSDSPVSIEYLDEKTYIILDSLSEKSINTEEVSVTGKTQSWGIDSIDVQYNWGIIQKIKTYNPKESHFTYVASARQKSLDFWKNEYVFTAHLGKDTSQVKMVIMLPWESKTMTFVSWLQDISASGSVTQTSTGKIEDPKTVPASQIHSLIEWLTISAPILSSLDCSQTDKITEFLLDRYTWAYWNTCRDTVKEKWISFYVLRLEGDSYMYEKHYYDFVVGRYWIFSLEHGEWLTKEMMGDKNKEFKLKDFSQITKKADDYFKWL
jgi:hypothetical protein